MASQPVNSSMVAAESDVSRWQATAMMALVQRLNSACRETTGGQPILTSEDRAELPHEQLIVDVATRRDREAFKLLFAHFAPRLKTYLSNLGMAGDGAEDLAQDTMVTVWQKAQLYHREKAAASTWIFQIARNKFIDLMRKQKYPEVDVDDHLHEMVAPDDTDVPLVQQRASQHVARAMEQLNPAQREVVELSFFHELSHSQIAEQLNLPLGTVKSRIRIAFDTLRKELGDFK